jgi:nitroreductase
MEDQRAKYLMEIIRERRSIRKYKPDPVPEKIIDALLESAILAPNGDNFQPWRFIVIKDKKTINAIGVISAKASGRRFLQEFYTGNLEKRLGAIPREKKDKIIKKMIDGRVSGFVGTAPLIIAVCNVPARGIDTPWDCAAATENLILLAQSFGLGTCWVIGPTKDPRDQVKMKALLNVPDNVHIQYVISIGYPDENPRPRPRLPLKEIVFSEQYNQFYYAE